ncbi:hypothetical protein ACLOJK_028844 [Asimina triloba]
MEWTSRATLRAPCHFLGECLSSKPSGRQRTTTVRGFLESQHKGRDKASRRPRGIQNSCRNMAATSTLVHRGVLGCPFDIEARALKILSDLLPVREEALQSRAKETLVGLLKDLYVAKETAVKLLAELDAAKAEWDAALDDANGGILAKRDLEQALEEATTKVTSLPLQKLDTEASICRLPDKGERAREEASKLSTELDVEESQADIVRLQAELEAPRAEPAQLQAESSEEAEGDASGQFKRTHYARCGFVKALLEVEALYLKLDLSSLYASSSKSHHALLLTLAKSTPQYLHRSHQLLVPLRTMTLIHWFLPTPRVSTPASIAHTDAYL